MTAGDTNMNATPVSGNHPIGSVSHNVSHLTNSEFDKSIIGNGKPTEEQQIE